MEGVPQSVRCGWSIDTRLILVQAISLNGVRAYISMTEESQQLRLIFSADHTALVKPSALKGSSKTANPGGACREEPLIHTISATKMRQIELI